MFAKAIALAPGKYLVVSVSRSVLLRDNVHIPAKFCLT